MIILAENPRTAKNYGTLGDDGAGETKEGSSGDKEEETPLIDKKRWEYIDKQLDSLLDYKNKEYKNIMCMQR